MRWWLQENITKFGLIVIIWNHNLVAAGGALVQKISRLKLDTMRCVSPSNYSSNPNQDMSLLPVFVVLIGEQWFSNFHCCPKRPLKLTNLLREQYQGLDAAT
jgi:hypothetical protein